MHDMEAPMLSADSVSRRNAVLVAAVCLATSLGFVALGGGALFGVFLTTEWSTMPPIVDARGQFENSHGQHLHFFILVLYGVAFSCFAAAAVSFFIGLRRLLRA
jgi:hypothetical protein